MTLIHSGIIGSVVLALGLASSLAIADTALVYQDGTGGLSTDVSSNLATHLTNAGYTTTNSSSLPTVTGFKQVWDVRYNNTTPLTLGDQSTYLGYLQGGGTLFLMGENAGFITRNNSIIQPI